MYIVHSNTIARILPAPQSGEIRPSQVSVSTTDGRCLRSDALRCVNTNLNIWQTKSLYANLGLPIVNTKVDEFVLYFVVSSFSFYLEM